ncbi:TIGR04066 family peptide maturation system protein [Clostridium amazonitimonense]|uniref:TIGR04066 family peptide maturation system protein n=1 Tax=Clostridium amazonitimonense TaxID=1499689 RepID=UPI00069066A6|nr:TIGR04066 family peptide maturation system protein [Clostridium amazonitimonense]
MTKKKAMIYPVDRESLPLIRYNDLIEEYDVIYTVSPKGWGFRGKDCGVLDGGKEINKTITDDFDTALNLCQCVIFVESDMVIDFEKMIFPKIEKALNDGKDIVCTIEIPDKFKERIEKLREIKNGRFKQYTKENKCDFKLIEKEYIFDINVPVIGVFGTTERTGKFDIQLALREKFMNQGYKVSQIGTRHYSEIMGFHSFPKFMVSSSINESNKIMLFNHYVKNIELTEKPDIILIGVPGGVMPYNNNYTNKFGILAFEVCNAVQFDSVVMSTLYEDYDERYFTTMHESLKYKLGLEIDAFNITPLKGDFKILDFTNRFGFLTLDSDFIDDKIRKFNNLDFKIFNILNEKNKEDLAEYLIDKLSSYSDIQAI